MEKLSINQWAEEDRPREKMILKGADALSIAELLAILVGSGTKEDSAVSLMQKVLARCDNNLNTLGKWNLNDFTSFKGLGPAKAITIMAAMELGRRRTMQEPIEKAVIKESTDIYIIFHPLLCDIPQEEFWLLLLNQAAKVIDKVRISKGGIDQTTVDVRSIMREAILLRATQIAVVHNHPSGNLKPSNEDINITNKIKKACDLLNIRLIDHVIVTETHFYSFHDHGLL
jgi:DNA repair protein RadC